MSWDGSVTREIANIIPVDDVSCRLVFRHCHYEQPLNYPMQDIYGILRQTICAQCSKPNWDKIGAIRDRIQFGDVLARLRQK